MPARKRFSLFGTLTVALAGALMIAVAVPATAGAVESTAGSTTVTDESGPFATTTYLSLDSDRIQVGELATMFIEVEGQDPTGDITVTEGATVLGQATLDNGMTDLSIDGLRAGSHTLTATYGGDAANDPSTSETVNLTVIKWSSELSVDLPPTAAVGSTVTATVLVSGGDHPGTGTVRLTRAGSQIASGALKSGQAVLSFPAGINAGSSWITASFDGDDVMGRSQESMQLTVVPAASTTTVTFAPASGVKAGTRLVATVTVKAAGHGADRRRRARDTRVTDPQRAAEQRQGRCRPRDIPGCRHACGDCVLRRKCIDQAEHRAGRRHHRQAGRRHDRQYQHGRLRQ